MDKQEESEKARTLLQKYLDGRCTPQEEEIVQRWFYSFDDKPERLSTSDEENTVLTELNARLDSILFADADSQLRSRKYTINKIVSIAAIVLCFIGVSLWGYLRQDQYKKDKFELAVEIPASNNKYKNDILPGSHFATFKYANGEEKVMRDSNFFSATGRLKAEELPVVVDVPKAGVYKIVLEDGTKVWLNSSSRLTYPERFSRTERLVSLEGEAYFEVAKDADRPFRIAVNDTQIEVLGTTFNVYAYDKEVRTSLVEGSVKIRNKEVENILKPGEEAFVLAESMHIEKANLDKNTAWQRGEFYFDGNNLSEVLEQISRWYNVDFDHADLLIRENSYKGSINRNTNLSNVLEILAVATGRDFTIQGRKVLIK